MKLTLNIDDGLLERVMAATGAKTKTEAIHMALGEIDRRSKLVSLLAEDIGLSPEEWKNAFDENSIPDDEHLSSRVAETPKRHDRKPRPGR